MQLIIVLFIMFTVLNSFPNPMDQSQARSMVRYNLICLVESMLFLFQLLFQTADIAEEILRCAKIIIYSTEFVSAWASIFYFNRVNKVQSRE